MNSSTLKADGMNESLLFEERSNPVTPMRNSEIEIDNDSRQNEKGAKQVQFGLLTDSNSKEGGRNS